MRKPIRKIQVRYACWGLLPAHVQKLRPDWTEEQALDWLIEHQQSIAIVMSRLGWQVLADALDERKAGHDR